MKKFKIFFALITTFLLVFTISVSASAAESEIENEIYTEVENYVAEGKLEDWHLDMMTWTGYVCFYNKMVKFTDNFEQFASYTEDELWTYVTWYQNHWDDTWEYIIDNIDIWPEYLEPNTILGLYWDSYFSGYEDEGYLYLIWVSHYTPSEFVTIVEFQESGTTYKLYDDQEARDNLDANWKMSDEFHFADANLTLHITPIGGISDGKPFGIPLKRKYTFEGFKYRVDEAHFGTDFTDIDPANKFGGKCEDTVSFDLGLTPKQDGQNSLQLVTHGYTIITDCEAQSYLDLNFGGYMHEVFFNTSIEIDKIYRVDVHYTLTNEDKEWFEFLKPNDEHEVVKSLTSERSIGGFFGMSNYQGFEEGSFQSVKDSSTNYKYKLHLNYDDDAWNVFRGDDVIEANYEKIGSFKIMRINFLVDNQTYDIPVQMDTITGKTLNILSEDLIMDTNSPGFKVKNSIHDFFAGLKDKYESSKEITWTVLGSIILVFIIFVIIKVYKWISRLLNIIPDNKDTNKNKRE